MVFQRRYKLTAASCVAVPVPCVALLIVGMVRCGPFWKRREGGERRRKEEEGIDLCVSNVSLSKESVVPKQHTE